MKMSKRESSRTKKECLGRAAGFGLAAVGGVGLMFLNGFDTNTLIVVLLLVYGGYYWVQRAGQAPDGAKKEG